MKNKNNDFYIDDQDLKAYTNKNFKNDPSEFQFAIVADNAGGARKGVFPKAVEMVNSLHPEFVVSVGDLIEGYSEEESEIREMWTEIDEHLEKLEMPFFFLPGNHDLNSDASLKIWEERFGSKRGYYHFRYKDVLFLMVNTEDPTKNVQDIKESDPEKYKMVVENYTGINKLMAKTDRSDEDIKKVLELAAPIEDWFGEINISDQQVEYFEDAIKENDDVRWTVCFIHAPPHFSPTSEGGKDPANFANIERLLEGKGYTVFSAHTHVYNYENRNGIDYITTATSGAMNIVRPGAMDHIVWVTMTKEGPKITNLLMNGILDKKGPDKGDTLEGVGLYKPKE